jgi:hypothetical protein
MERETLLIILGGLLLAVGILGGGFSIKELQVPTVGMIPRVIAFVIGVALIGFGANLREISTPENPRSEVAPVATPPEASSPKQPETPQPKPQTPMNLAINGNATQSSTAFDGDPRRAIDNVTNGHYFSSASVSHTADMPNSYWQVRLDSPATFTRIVLFNRSDCCTNRLSNFRLSVLDGDREAFGLDFDGTVGREQAVPLPANTRGQTVRVQLKGVNREGNGILSLAEVQVFGVAE